MKLFKSFKNKLIDIKNKYFQKQKIMYIRAMIFDVLFTGLMIWIVLNHQNFISYGIAAALFCYYFEYIVNTIKKPYMKK